MPGKGYDEIVGGGYGWRKIRCGNCGGVRGAADNDVSFCPCAFGAQGDVEGAQAQGDVEGAQAQGDVEAPSWASSRA